MVNDWWIKQYHLWKLLQNSSAERVWMKQSWPWVGNCFKLWILGKYVCSWERSSKVGVIDDQEERRKSPRSKHSRTSYDRRWISESRVTQVIPGNSVWIWSILKISLSTLAILPDIKALWKWGKMPRSHINLHFGWILLLMHFWTYWEPHWTHFVPSNTKGLLTFWNDSLFLTSWLDKAAIWVNMIRGLIITLRLMSLSYSRSP